MQAVRHCHPIMVNFFDLALKDNDIAQHAIEQKAPRALMIEAAKSAVNKIMEIGGNNHGPLVGAVQSVLGADVYKQKGDGASWCMSDVQTMIAYAELKTGILSKIYPTEHCMTCWRNTPTELRVKYMPLPGAIEIYEHFNKDKSGLYMVATDEGHTGIMEQYLGATQISLEGNTTSGEDANGKIIRDGGGDYRTIRSTKLMDKTKEMQLHGWLIPFPVKEIA